MAMLNLDQEKLESSLGIITKSFRFYRIYSWFRANFRECWRQPIKWTSIRKLEKGSSNL